MASSSSRNKPALYKPTDFNSQQKSSQMKGEEKNKSSVDYPKGSEKEHQKAETDNPQKRVTILKPPLQSTDTKASSVEPEAAKFIRVSDKDRDKIQKLREFMEKQQQLSEHGLDETNSKSERLEKEKNNESKNAVTEKSEKERISNQKSTKVTAKSKGRYSEKASKKGAAANTTKQGNQLSESKKQLKEKQNVQPNEAGKPKRMTAKPENKDRGKQKQQQQKHNNDQSQRKYNNQPNFGRVCNNLTNPKMLATPTDAASILGNPYQHPVGSSKQHQASNDPSKHQPSRQTNQNSFGPGPGPSSALKTSNPHLTVPATKDKNEHKRSLDFVKNFFNNDPEVQYHRKKNAEKILPAASSPQIAPLPTLSNALSNTYVSTDSELASYLSHGRQNQGNILPQNMSMAMSMTSNYSNLYNVNAQNQMHIGTANNAFSQGAAASLHQHQRHQRSSPSPFQTIGHGSIPQQHQRSFEMYTSASQSVHTPSQQGHFPVRSHTSAHTNAPANNFNLLNSYSNYFPHGSPHSHIFHVQQEVDQAVLSSVFKDSNISGKWQQKALSKCGPIDSKQARALIEQLIDCTYECMVCCESIKFNSSVWNCSSCFHIFHLPCIRKWAKSEAASVKDQNGWRCPGCQNVSTRPPNKYFCFCGKVRDPDWTPKDGITPHSCGEVCGKTRLNPPCEHTCNELCHPGPCPACPVMVTKSCFCRKTSTKRRCGLLSTLTCENECSKPLACGKHFCSLKCHEGPCQLCDIKIVEECFCSNTKRLVICGSDEVVSILINESVDEFVQKAFSCKQVCGRILACGNHRCEDTCHHGECKDCPLLPEFVQHCPCKKVELSSLLPDEKRMTCLDTIPTCDNFCGRKLPCGSKAASHLCMVKCHSGSCKPCEKKTQLSCRCGGLKKDIECKELIPENVLLCDRKCNKKRRCGRHKCNQKCCVDKEHNCNVVCGKKLSCGQHRCEEVCHTGFCSPCWRAGFDELSCRCGATVLYPPIACGTKPPECDQPCKRPHPCCHPPQHSCHNEEVCPPCTVLMTRNCMGGHEAWKSVPCHLNDISCGKNCGKPLKCGNHLCKKPCHKGDCLCAEEMCLQSCTKPRLDCNHQCNAPCHVGFNCPQTICKVQVTLTCRCRRKAASVICNAGNINSAFQSFNTEMLSMQLKNLQSGQTIDITGLADPEKRPKFLECDEVCSVMERNKRLAEALEIDRGEKDHFQVMIFSAFLKQEARLRLPFLQSVETAFENLLLTTKKSSQPVRHSFPPMNTTQRKIIHELSECYGFKTYSVDSEPKRSTVVIATKDSFMPQVKLSAITEMELGVPTTCVQSFPRSKTLKSILKQPSSQARGKRVNYFDDDDDDDVQE